MTKLEGISIQLSILEKLIEIKPSRSPIELDMQTLSPFDTPELNAMNTPFLKE